VTEWLVAAVTAGVILLWMLPIWYAQRNDRFDEGAKRERPDWWE
jgi:hypothetical protein